MRRILRQKQRAEKQAKQAKVLAAPLPPLPPPEPQVHSSFYPDYPEDWIDITEESSEDYLLPTHVANVHSRTIYSVTETSTSTLVNAPPGVRNSVMALRDINTELHEHTNTVHGIKDLVLAQNRDVHILAIKKLVVNEPIDNEIFPEDVREFARNHFRQKNELLFNNKNNLLCIRYPPSQRALHKRPCMIVMPQLYQHEILFRAYDALGHQGISKVVACIHGKYVGKYVGQCLTCQQVQDKLGD